MEQELKTNELDAFLEQENAFLLEEVTNIVKHLQSVMRISPEEYTEFGADEPTIDVRLCVDLDSHGGPNWIFRTGLVDYDPYHSEYCSASCIGLDTKPEELLEQLLGDLGEGV